MSLLVRASKQGAAPGSRSRPDASNNPLPPDPIYVFRSHEAQVQAICFSKDPTIMCSGDSDGVVIVWNLKIRRPLFRWTPHPEKGVLGLALVEIPNEPVQLITHGRDMCLHIWDMSWLLPQLIHDDDENDDGSTGSVNAGNDKSDHVGGGDGPALLDKHIATIPVNPYTFCSFSLLCIPPSPTGGSAGDGQEGFIGVPEKIIAYPNLHEETKVDVLDLRTKQPLHESFHLPDSKTGTVMVIKLFVDTASTPLLMTGYESGSVAVCKVKSGELLWKLDLHQDSVLSLDIFDGGSTAVSTGADGRLVKFSLDSKQSPPSVLDLDSNGIATVAVRPDGRIVATGGWDSRIRLFTLKKLKPLAVLSHHRESIRIVAFQDLRCGSATEAEVAENGAADPLVRFLLYVGGKDGHISLWDIYGSV
ncbi:WD40-repeat-containing domain protein [Polychytrium aggregatum]|uniref:WD40-repeat-containing domain protein n=1 Tax=Polychytrium aggregatum TaxID=110093 RepID=UPI0022FEA420|nr:WD40-repeat-containing domain protein [Polychytrium aggregatum]KAI9199328.1 WD40-repeat-containing domain protein [Polychytrium aggregatum]